MPVVCDRGSSSSTTDNINKSGSSRSSCKRTHVYEDSCSIVDERIQSEAETLNLLTFGDYYLIKITLAQRDV